jgi:uncharacterized membrane protein
MLGQAPRFPAMRPRGMDACRPINGWNWKENALREEFRSSQRANSRCHAIRRTRMTEIAFIFFGIIIVCLWIKIGEISRRQKEFKELSRSWQRRLESIEAKLKHVRAESVQALETEPVGPAPVKATPALRAPAEKQPLSEKSPTTGAPPPAAMRPSPIAINYRQETPSPRPPIPPPPVAPPPLRPRVSSPPVQPPAPPKPAFDWESLVGVKLFSWIAGVALLLAAVFFLRYSIARGWLMPPVQMTIGIVVGIGLLLACELKAARKYRITADAMDASAIAILFSTFFAAHDRWHLIGTPLAFVFMVLVTAVAVLLSIRRDSIFIALLGLLGGFATPALLSTGENKPISLFSYLLLLNAGLSWVASKKKWPILTTLSLIFTVLYQWIWVDKFLDVSPLPIALGIFLVFPILSFIGLSLGQKENPDADWLSLYGKTAHVSAVLPLLFALYMAATPAYGHSYYLLFGFLFILDIGLFAIAVARKEEILHWIGALSTILIFAIWLGMSYESRAWPIPLAIAALFAIFYLVAPFIARSLGREFTEFGCRAVYAAPLLLFVFPCLAAMEPECAHPGWLFGMLFATLAAISAYAIRHENGIIYCIGALFALAAEAVWSAKYLKPERLFSGLAIYVVFGLFFICAPMVARRLGKRLKPEGASAGLLVIGLMLLLFFASGSMAAISIWGLALLLLLLNLGLLIHGAACKLPGLAMAGMGLSWIVLGVLWASVSLATILLPALVVVAGFALLVLAGNIWLKNQTPEGEDSSLGNGIFLGLTGHIFLLAVAGQPSLTQTPWPFLGILFLLTLAVSVAALHTRRSDLHLSSMIACGILLTVWSVTAGAAPYPGLALLSAGALAFLGLAWIYPAHRAGADAASYRRTAAITIVFAQIVAVVASMQPGSPSIGNLVCAHVIFLVALLCLTGIGRVPLFAALALLPTAAAVSLWILQNEGSGFWLQPILFAAPIYLVFIAYPLILGRRCGKLLEPYLAAVLAGIPFFFEARHAIIQAGWKPSIGILPVCQALLMAILLLRLLNIEPRGMRRLGRLALVAGAALAFITVAIPLQLDKEWITIGWALEGAALAWLYGKIPHQGLLLAVSGLFTAVFIRLAMNPSVLYYRPRGAAIWNWYLYAYLVASAALFLGGWFLSRTRDVFAEGMPRVSKFLSAGGAILLFLLLNIEITDFYSEGSTITLNFGASLSQDLTYTLGWALFGVALLTAGIMIKSQPARIAALALLVVTIFKCFFYDLSRLGGLYRVVSLLGLAICLALVALALQKFVLSARKEAK